MLSFMREQEIETDKQPGQEPTNAAELPGTMPMSPSEQYLTASHTKQIRKSNYVLVVLFCVGLLILWLMIKKSAPQSASASTAGGVQIEALLAKFTGVKSEMFNSLDEISDRFYKFADVKQVKNDELVKNPFKMEAVWGNFGRTANLKAAPENTNSAIAKQTEQSYAGHMQLLSIMAADARKCCMIDDRILYEGDSIKGFKVRQINSSSVTLEPQATPDEPNSGKGIIRNEIILRLSE